MFEPTINFIQTDEPLEATLNPRGNMLATKHIFEPEDIDAINAAIACRRPLLITGEPGTGKSQLARAAASRLKRVFVSFSVDSRTESRDLLWTFDAIGRLADAQLGKALSEVPAQLRRELAVKYYVHPGPLWWGFNWKTALDQEACTTNRLLDNKEESASDNKEGDFDALAPEQWDEGDPVNGCVVLIDEIDKAEPSVPNGLLEALGDGSFSPEGIRTRVTINDIPPLVIITSNKERTLPDAFMRRCLVLNLGLPKDEDALINSFVKRGRAHFKEDDLPDTLLNDAAVMVVKDRKKAEENHYRPLPGLASYIDLLRGVYQRGKDHTERGELLHKVRKYAVAKGFEPAQ